MTARTGRLGRVGAAWGTVCGVLAAAVAIGIAQLIAGLSIPNASPVIAVGQAAINLTPLPVKDWATSTFGTNDKNVLLTGVLVVVFLYSIVVGIVAMRRLSYGFIATIILIATLVIGGYEVVGRVAFAYSGVQSRMLPVLAKADLIDVSDDHGGLGYQRDFSRSAPDNLFGSPLTLLKRAGHSAKAVNVGFTFDDAVPAGGTRVSRVTASYPATKVQFTWDAASGRWLAAMNHRKAMATEGGQLGGTTVIIQYTTVTRSIYHDFLGNYTPLSRSVGSGTALFLRNGQYWRGTWSRPSASAGTTWTVAGKPFPMAAGQIWVLLINKKTPATIG